MQDGLMYTWVDEWIDGWQMNIRLRDGWVVGQVKEYCRREFMFGWSNG